jgi:hypothetical protein
MGGLPLEVSWKFQIHRQYQDKVQSYLLNNSLFEAEYANRPS